MKDFTSYYAPRIDAEIRARYPRRITDPATLASLHADALLTETGRGRHCIAIRIGDPATLYGISAIARHAWEAIREYAAAAETYPGELDSWTWREEARISTEAKKRLAQETPPPHGIPPALIDALRAEARTVYDDGDRIRVYTTGSDYETPRTLYGPEEARAALDSIRAATT